MTDEDIIARVAKMFGVAYHVRSEDRDKNWKAAYSVRLRGKRAVELMQALRPLMGQRRQSQIDAAIETWEPKKKRITREQGEAIVAAFRAKEKTAAKLAEEHGITKWSVYALHQGRYWKTAA